MPKARELFQKGVWAAPGNNADVVKVFQVGRALTWLTSEVLVEASEVAGVLLCLSFWVLQASRILPTSSD